VGACLVATSFKGWGGTWGGSWGPISTNPNDMSASGGFVLLATAQATAILFAQGSSPLSVSATGTLTAAVVSNDMAGTAAFTFSAIGILTDPNAYPDRRPKSTNRLRLQRISEGHGVALSARAVTRVRAVRAAGAEVLPVPVHYPGSAVCLPCRSKSRSRVSHARGSALARPLRGRSFAWVGNITAVGAATSALSPGFVTTFARATTGAGAARATAGGFMAVSGHGYAIARGGKNLPDAVLAAVVRATIDTRR